MRTGIVTTTGAVLGIDIGGTKLAAGVVTPEGCVLAYRRIATPSRIDAESLLETVIRLGRGVQDQHREETAQPVVALGIGCGGPMIFPDGVVSPLHIKAWTNFPLRARLAQAFQLPTVLDNDAKAFALGEALFGAGRDSSSLLGMVVSTGVGGGIVVNGRLYHGTTGNAGHIGHTVISTRGPRCACGSRGCLTAYASGTGLVLRARAALQRGVLTSLTTVAANELTGEAIAHAAIAGDKLAQKLMRDAAMALSCGITDAAAILDLDQVILGGGLVRAGDILLAPVRANVARRVRTLQARDLDIAVAGLGEYSGVIGAAALVLHDLGFQNAASRDGLV